MIGTDYLHALCIEGQVYKTDPLPQCDSNQFLILESTPGSPATKKKKFWKGWVSEEMYTKGSEKQARKKYIYRILDNKIMTAIILYLPNIVS